MTITFFYHSGQKMLFKSQ